ncbi:hypothetical protein MMC16_002918 [Acarospora aff. strigata]|nr:hypothetical protein [Acarospora aff. strigata]
MQLTQLTSTLLLLAATSYAAINGRCSVNGTPGTCISTATCSGGGGKSNPGFCPNDPDDIQCCTKTSCGSGGNCRWTDQCSGTTQAGLCPGPDTFKCCLSGGSTTNPTIPAYKCQAHVISAGNTILNQFPGQVKTVYCYADKPGDHGLGLALDLMVGIDNPIGRTIAEWAMNHAGSLRVKYIIWSQRIWNVERGEAPTAWTNWRLMEDRGDPTANHRDHPHISFFA